jgi:RNA polymerase primary sigma factor
LLSHDDEIFIGKKIETCYGEILKILSMSDNFLSSLTCDLRKVVDGTLHINFVLFDKDGKESELDSIEIHEQFHIDSSAVEEIQNVLDQTHKSDRRLDAIQDFINAIPQLHFSDLSCYEGLVNLGISYKYIQNYCYAYSGKIFEIDELIEESISCRNKLVLSNVRLANHICRGYAYMTSLPYAELLQEGMIGLIKGAEKFDYKKGFRFTTYATWWIRQSVSRFIQDQGRLIRLPVHVNELVNKIDRADKQYEGLTLIQKNMKLSESLDISIGKLNKARGASFHIYSLDNEVDDLDQLAYLSIDNEKDYEDTELNSIIKKILDDLPSRDADVLRLRFGIDGCEPYTLEEIGEFYGVTRERVRQIESKLMKNFKKPSVLKKLNGYFQDKRDFNSDSGN